ncbi:hypothetical protein D3C81_1535100 [compost metagenome]
MSAFNDHITGACLRKPSCRFLPLLQVSNLHIREQLCLGNIGSDNQRKRQQVANYSAHGFLLKKGSTALGNHHRINHKVPPFILGYLVRHDADNIRAEQHSRLDRIRI